MILFSEIYERAINLFDDPEIQRAYVFDPIKWQKMMYPYLRNGINKFTNPTKVSWLLIDQNAPMGQMETFSAGDDPSAESYKSVVLSTEPKDDSTFGFIVDGKNVNATYDKDTKTVTFDESIPTGTQAAVEWYYSGAFNTDFSAAATSTAPAGVIAERVKHILSHALVIAWAEDEQNFLLDIKNVLTDTDFKVYSPANSIKAKTEWVKQLQFDFDTVQTKLAWDVFSVGWHGGAYYGRK